MSIDNDSVNSAQPASEAMLVEVSYARPDTQVILEVEVPRDTTVEQAIEASGILNKFPDIDLKVNKVGIFGKLTKLANPMQEKDRVEIYRKLIADPKQVRKQRAAQGKQMKKGGDAATKEARKKDRV